MLLRAERKLSFPLRTHETSYHFNASFLLHLQPGVHFSDVLIKLPWVATLVWHWQFMQCLISCQTVLKTWEASLLLVSVNLRGNSPSWITGITLKRPQLFTCEGKHESIFLPDWMLNFHQLGHYFYSRFSSASKLQWLPEWEKSHPQNSNGTWQRWGDHLICRNDFVLSLWVLQLNGTADKPCQCVFSHLAALLTHWVFWEAFIQEEMHMGATACVNKILSKTTHLKTADLALIHTPTHFSCPPPPEGLHKKSTFLHKTLICQKLSDVLTADD